MKKGFIFLGCFIVTLGFISFANAGMREPMEGAGWHYPWKDTYSEWKPGNMKYDEELFNQDVIEAYGWEAEDVDKIKDMIPPSMYIILKNPDIWGPRRINVTAYRENKGYLWDRFVKATKEYKDTAKIDKGWLINYTAGVPFPEPKDGIEALWNFKQHFREDDRILSAVTIITNRGGQVRYQTSDGNLMYFDGRLEKSPKPLYKSPNNERRIDAYANAHPYEMRGTLSVITQYDDPEMDDSFWLYLPALRRVRRLSAAQRTDRLPGGQDLMWENFDVFNGNPSKYNCKLMGKKEMLFVHNGDPKGSWIHGKHLSGPNDYYQKVQVYINELTPKDPDFPFSKVILYTDSKTWVPYYGEWYDKEGKLYLFSQFQYAPNKNGIFVAVVMNHVDMQKIHSTGYAVTDPKFNTGLTPDYFKVDSLKMAYPSR
ncbi:DUF1329 domain-containing protein [Desulfobacula toluolica]|uniref:Conserved uncharacterized protein, DUF1329 n=1 Tax=Desulfobacula toluolica (strain DSM 7467 / Tol2) TaxID=651182 RepID=K0NNR9_DESTT|nr:DUF1329 domain-containing protein [Desulfobacula toluolica]CCK82310.1 conserved uncharacterized protein, DUF1329 [Desulfobacula toluolica Tol2]